MRLARYFPGLRVEFVELHFERSNVAAVFFVAIPDFAFQRLDRKVSRLEKFFLARQRLPSARKVRIERVGYLFAGANFGLPTQPLGTQLFNVIAQFANGLRVAATAFLDVERGIVGLAQPGVRRVVLAKSFGFEF